MTSEHPNVGGPGEATRVELVLARRFQMKEVLSRDGALTVFAGRDLKTDATIQAALAGAPGGADVTSLEALKVEVAAIRALSHPAHVKPIQVGLTEDGRLFLITEPLAGTSLGKLLESGPLPPEDALRLSRTLLAALAEAHERGVVHRAIKPSNIIIHDVGDGPQVSLTGYGVARAVTGDLAPGRSTLQIRLGTPAYSAPELLLGGPSTKAGDVYSLGLVLLEMLTGERTNKGGTVAKMISAQLGLDPQSELARVPDSPLKRIISKALQREPVDRYAHAGQMLRDLMPTRPAEARPTGLTPQSEPTVDANELAAVGEAAVLARVSASRQAVPERERRSRGGVALLIFLLALVGAGTVYMLSGQDDSDDAAADDGYELVVVDEGDAETSPTGEQQGSGSAMPERTPLVPPVFHDRDDEGSGQATADEARDGAAAGVGHLALAAPGEREGTGQLGATGAPAPDTDTDGAQVAVPDSATTEMVEPDQTDAEAAVVEDVGQPTTDDDGEAPTDETVDGVDESAVVVAASADPEADAAPVDDETPDEASDEEPAEADDQPPAEGVFRLELRLTSEPSRARITMDGESIGRTPFDGIIESTDERVTLTISKREHQRSRLRLDMTRGSLRRHVELEPDNPFGNVGRMGGNE